MINSARGGGSITPRFAKILNGHVSSGKLTIHTNTTLKSVSFEDHGTDSHWRLATVPVHPDTPRFDHVYFATGVQSDISQLPYMSPMLETHPIDILEGLPVITEDMMWREDVPLFVTGKFAALRLGPGAGNLEGARIGAERIAWAMEDILKEGYPEAGGSKRRDSGIEVDDEEDTCSHRYQWGLGSRFEALIEQQG